MKRAARILVNLGLAVFSAFLTFQAVALLDVIAGWVTPERNWPGPSGLLFIPGSEDHYEMHDYTCSDYINSLGFRDREFSPQKGSAIRAVAIGDSFTYGWGVNIEDAWCKRLEANLRRQGMDIEILNLGKPAAGPREYARIAEYAIPRLKPDLVILCVLAGEDLPQLGDSGSFDPENYIKDKYPNILRLIQHLRQRESLNQTPTPPKRTSADSRQWYAATAQEIVNGMPAAQRARFDALEASVKEAFFQGKLNPWMIGQATASPEYFMNTLKQEDVRVQIRRLEKSLGRIRKASARTGARLVALTIPEGFYVNKEAYRNVGRIGFQAVPEMMGFDAPDLAVGEACRRAGITSFHSVSEEFLRHAEEPGLYFEFDRHMTAAGNALYAELLTPIIAEEVRNIQPRRAVTSEPEQQ